MKIFRFIASIVLLFLVMSPSAISNAEDNVAPMITNVQVVSDGNSNYDTQKPNVLSWLFGTQDTPIGIVGTNITFNVTATDDLSGVKQVVFELESPNGSKIIELNKASNTYWTYSLSLESEDIGIWSINKISVEDFSGNINEVTPENSKVYVLPSDYTSYNNGNIIGMTDTHNKIKISFSEPIDVTTLNTDNIMMFEYDGSDKTFTLLNDYSLNVAEEQNSLIIERNTWYEQDKNYYVIAHKNIKDKDGNNLANPMFIKLNYVPGIYQLYGNYGQVLLDVPMQKRGDEFLAPLRTVSELLGVSANWDATKRQIILDNNETTLILGIDDNTAIINEVSEVLDVTPEVINGRTVVPLIFIATTFGANVEVNSDEKYVRVTTSKKEPERGAFVPNVPLIDSNFDGTVTDLIIKDELINFTTGDTFRLSLPTGVEWNKSYYETTQITGIRYIADENKNDLKFEFTDTGSRLVIPLSIRLNGYGIGDVKVTIDSMGSSIRAGQYTFAIVVENQ